MKRDMLRRIAEYTKDRRNKKIWYRVVTCLAAVVVFCTTYALILPAITMESDGKQIHTYSDGKQIHTYSNACYTQVTSITHQEPICTLESQNIHEHTDDCYDEDGELICGYADFVVHEHDDNCYDEDGELWCPLPEIKAHTHKKSCYAESEKEKPASSEAGNGHVHTEDCYEIVQAEPEEVATGSDADQEESREPEKVLICDLEETEISDSADREEDEDEERELICDQEEIILHKHTKKCFDEDGHVICGKLQILEHEHTNVCFFSWLDAHKAEIVATQDECAALIEKMMAAYQKCFEEDHLLIPWDQIEQIDEIYDSIESWLYDCYGYRFVELSSVRSAPQRIQLRTLKQSMGVSPLTVQPTEDEEEPDVFVDKTVDQTKDGFLLTLKAYVTGETITSSVTKPADILLVLDQSASQLYPVGEPNTPPTNRIYRNSPAGLKRYEYEDFIDLPNVQENASHLGYYIVQSRIPINNLYPYYVVKYSDGGWKFWEFLPPMYPNVSNSGKCLTFDSLREIPKNRFYFYETQYSALYSSASKFISGLQQSGLNHRVGIVGFSRNTESRVYINGKQSSFYPYIRDDTYSQVLTTAEKAMRSLDAFRTVYGYTSASTGLDMAINVFDNAPKVETDIESIGRDRIVILFTDGGSNMTTDGTHVAEGNGQDTEPKQEAVEKAYVLKNQYQAKVYAFGTASLSNELYMEYLSSNYPEAETMDNPGAKASGIDYSQNVVFSDELDIAFSTVSTESSQTVNLESETVLKEVISDYFELPNKMTSDIKVFTADYAGKDDNGNAQFDQWTLFEDADIKLSESSNDGRKDIIEVTNFDYAGNYVDDDDTEDGLRGKELIVQVPIVVRNGFWGGNNVPTNEDATAILNKNIKVKPFPMPEVNVPINPTIEVRDKTIYYGSQVAAKELVEISAGGAQVEINDDGTLTPREDWMDDYATLSWTEGSTTANSAIDNTNCAQYKYSVDQKPKYDGSENRSQNPGNIVGTPVIATGETVSDTSQIHVLVPVLTYQDSEIHLGDTPDADYFEETNHVPGVTWVDIEDYTPARQADEKEPALYFSYQPNGDFLTSAVPVDVTVTRGIPDGELDMTGVTQFLWNSCSNDLHVETLHNIESPHLGQTRHPEFWIHVRSGYELPNTGGAGTVPYTIGGLLFMTAGIGILLIRSLSAERRRSHLSDAQAENRSNIILEQLSKYNVHN